MNNTATFAAAAIPVENIRCPVLLISGGDDQMWPSEIYADQIFERMGDDYDVGHWSYLEAGHGITRPSSPHSRTHLLPPCCKALVFHGRQSCSRCCSKSSAWDEILQFFDEHLKNRTTQGGFLYKKAVFTFIASILTATTLVAAPRAVVFDFGGVLTGKDDREVVISFIQKSFDLSREEFDKALLRKCCLKAAPSYISAKS